MSVRNFEALRPADQSEYLVKFLEKMTYDIGQKNPQLAARIKDYYVRNAPGKPYPEGLEEIEIQLALLDRKAERGEVDLTKVEIEGLVVGVTTRRFPPDQNAVRRPGQ